MDHAAREDMVSFWARGELVLAEDARIPMKIQALSYNGFLPEVVELTSRGLGEFALREGFEKGVVELSICGQQFSAHLVDYHQNSPLQWVRAADVFAALFPYAAATPRTVAVPLSDTQE